MALLKSITTVGGYTLLSRVLGFVRDILIAAMLGAGMAADAFFVAFKLPNLFRRLFAEGAFASAFVPLYAGEVEANGKENARVFAEEVFSVLLVSLLFFVAVVEMAMPWVMRAFAPGFLATPEKFDLTVHLTRITFPYLMFVSLASMLGGVLNSLGRFAAAAATPALLNVFLIGALLILTPMLPTPGHALAWGVAAAGVAQFAWLYVACRRAGAGVGLRRPRLTAKVKLLLRRILPVALGAGVYQVSLVIDMIVASLLPAGSISYLFYADRVTQLPLGVVGVAVGTALLPLLSRQVRAGDDAQAADSQNRAIEFALLLTVPAAAALCAIADPVIAALFERGRFGAHEVAATGAALGVFALGLPAYVLVKALAPGFFAREDTATPVKVSVACLFVNLALVLILMRPLLHVGIALATAITSWLNALLLGTLLHRRGHFRPDARLRRRLPRLIIATVGMLGALWAGRRALAPLLAGGQAERILGLGLLIGLGLLAFAVLAQVLGVARLRDLKSLYKGRPAT